MSESPLTRKERERQRHRKEIMAAAERVFAEKGYHECSIQDIATAAEFSVGTIYNFFDNKESLLSSIIKEGHYEMRRAIDQRLGELACPVEKIRAVVACHMEKAEKHKNLLRLLFDYNNPRPFCNQNIVDQEMTQSHREVLDMITGLFSQAIEQEKIKNLNPRYLAIGIIGMMVKFFELFTILDELDSYLQVTPIIDEIFLKQILTGK